MSPVPDVNTLSLLHFDGADASTVFTDESGKAWTANGNAQLDTSIYKFHPSSGMFDGTGDWIDTPDHADFNLGSGDFTFDFHMYVDGSGGDGTYRVLGQTDSAFTLTNTSMFFQYQWIGGGFKIVAACYVGSTEHAIERDNISAGWHHIAISRNGGDFGLALDGDFFNGFTEPISGAINNSPAKFAIGRAGENTSNPFLGWIDEFRFSNICRWTTDFSPPAYPYGYSFIPKIVMSGE